MQISDVLLDQSQGKKVSIVFLEEEHIKVPVIMAAASGI